MRVQLIIGFTLQVIFENSLKIARLLIYYMTEKITNARDPGTVILLALFLNENHAVLQMTEQF